MDSVIHTEIEIAGEREMENSLFHCHTTYKIHPCYNNFNN